MPRKASAIPVGTQFSPDVVDLVEFIKALIAHSGAKPSIETAVGSAPVRIKARSSVPTTRTASLPVEAAVQYGLLEEKSYKATDLARKLARLTGQPLYDAFGRHILLKRGGLRIVEAAQQMKLDGLAISGDRLAQTLTDQGFPVTVHNTAINSLRMWLERAGVFGGGGRNAWEVSETAKRKLLGLTDDQIAVLVGLNEGQRAFAIALCRINPRGDHMASDVRALAETITGRPLARSSLPNNYLKPLERAGLITFKSGGTAGGKSATLRTNADFASKLLEPFLTITLKDLDAALTAYYKKPIADTYAELDSSDPGVKGQALEAFAIYVMRLLGLRFLYWRRKAKETGQAEVDVVMNGVLGGQPTRWQIQCKNTPGHATDLEDVAKEVGLLPITNATHIAVFARGGFTSKAEAFAAEIMRNSSVVIYLVGAAGFAHLKQDPGSLAALLRADAERIAALTPHPGLWST